MANTRSRLLLVGLLSLAGGAQAQPASSGSKAGTSTFSTTPMATQPLSTPPGNASGGFGRGGGGNANAGSASMAGGGLTVAMPTSGMSDLAGARNLVLEAGAGRIMSLPAGAANIFVADPKVVEVRPASATSLFMFGVAPGRTTVAAMDNSGHPVSQFEVTVRPSAFGASEAASAIARALPGSNIQVETTPKSLVLTGQVRDASMSERAQTLAASYAGQGQTVENRLTLASSIQVGLRVRIVEMSRALTRQLGLNWQILGSVGSFATTGFSPYASIAAAATAVASGNSALGVGSIGTGDFNAVLDLLSSDNLVRTLAEPNLITQSGETASFLAGGEYPIPVSQINGAISVDYKEYGVQLSFVPTVLSDRRISLHVRPEVSDLDTAHTVNGVPALTERRADTTVELGSGQSFAIAGLLQDTVNHNVNALPFLGDIPVLGALFRSDSFQRTETELVIVVTPYIVKPVSDPTVLKTPTYNPPNDLDRLVRLKQLGPSNPVPPTRATTNAGFLVE